ncbi:MAG: glutamate racemase [Firmicutes bacterium]|nr:glutamate racemase [Bacillota bacterium]
MGNRPIGFFDSGLGGLTTIPYLAEQLPEEKIVYFGDTARTPYGSKAVSTIRQFAMEIADFLRTHDVKMIVTACNTVSATCLDLLREKYPDIPIIGVIEPAARTVARICDDSNNIGIIGTKATISGGAYEDAIARHKEGLSIYSEACPIFVPLIEEGILGNEITTLAIKYYLDRFIYSNHIDTLVLGCTHYPMIQDEIERLYPGLQIINPSMEVISAIETVLREKDMLAKGSEFENTFYASDLSENFLNMTNTILEGSRFKVAFKNLEL